VPRGTARRCVSDIRDLGSAFRGGPLVALALTAAAWISIGVAHVAHDVRFTVAFLLLAGTAPIVALFSFVAEHRPAAFIAFLLTLAAPVAAVLYIARQSGDWLG